MQQTLKTPDRSTQLGVALLRELPTEEKTVLNRKLHLFAIALVRNQMNQ
jgi:hypothetical protein